MNRQSDVSVWVDGINNLDINHCLLLVRLTLSRRLEVLRNLSIQSLEALKF